MRLDSGKSFLINASPDLRTQILSTPLLSPAQGFRDTPIDGILLTSADVDSVMGLLHLREFQPLRVYSTPSIRRILLEDNHIFRVLERAKPPVIWQDIPLNEWFPLGVGNASGEDSIRCLAVPLGNDYPDYVSKGLRDSIPANEAVIGFVLAEGDKQFFYAPSLPGSSGKWKDWALSSDLCLLDGTFWKDDELISMGASSKTAREIGHVPLSAEDGLLRMQPSTKATRRVLIHMNNTNPILNEQSAEHREVIHAGWEIAYDGMEFNL